MKTPVLAGAPMMKLTIGGRVKVMVPSLKVARDIYNRTRDESGEGASTFPDGLIVREGASTLRISYNGRLWDGETIVAAE